LSKWILYWDKQWKKYEISLYLYDWVKKNVYWRNYQHFLMVYTTCILVSKTRLKRGRPIGSKDKNSWMKKGAKMKNDLIEKV